MAKMEPQGDTVPYIDILIVAFYCSLMTLHSSGGGTDSDSAVVVTMGNREATMFAAPHTTASAAVKEQKP